MGIRRAPALWIVAIGALGLLVGILAPPSAAASGQRANYLVGAEKQHAVPVSQVKGKAVKVPSMARWNVGDARSTWPAKGAAEMVVPLQGVASASGHGVPVSVAAAKGAHRTAAGTRVRVSLPGQTAAQRLGVHGVVFTVRPDKAGTAQVGLDYSAFRDSYGGDWAGRLRLVQLPACALTTPQAAACRRQTPLTSTNDTKTQTVSAAVPLTAATTAQPMVLAAEATASGGGGTYAATSLAPSGQWSAGGSSGAFTYSYPISVPDVPGSLTPSVSLDYSSQSVDGRTSSTNAQSSWIGDGWDYSPGFVERGYASCSDDTANGSPKTSDECWSDDVDTLTLSLNGSSNTLVHDGKTGTWHPQGDNGEKIDVKTDTVNGDNDNEYFVVTTADGTKYYFGLNRLPGWTTGAATTNSVYTTPVYGNDTGEPCHASTFADSWCQQGYRWNLDYTVDPHGNAVSYWYTPTTGYYGRDNSTTPTPYTRDGYLSKIQYGQLAGKVYDSTAPAAAQVFFDTSERCLPDSGFDCASAKMTTANASHWPDVPVDQVCPSSGTCANHGPAFFTNRRLTGIRTQVLVGTAYKDVDAWTLSHTFPSTGDTTTPSLWLSQIVHTGKDGGSLDLPPVKFAGQALANRVDGLDGYQPITRYRITTVTTESGEVITVNYTGPQCHRTGTAVLPSSQDGNTLRCYPQYWTPPGQTSPQLDWFNKFVVNSVTAQDPTGGGLPVQTSYKYLGDPAWHFNDDPMTQAKYRTWNQWRGYGTVETRTGTSPATITLSRETFFRGMDGDKTSSGTRSVTLDDSANDDPQKDSDWLAGQGFEAQSFNGDGGALLSDGVTDPWSSAATATQTRTNAGLDPLVAHTTNIKRARTVTTKADGTKQTTEVDYTIDPVTGLPTAVDDQGDTSTSTDDKCTRTWYVQDSSGANLPVPRRVQELSVSCSATPDYTKDLVSDDLTFFDNSTDNTAVPTKGDVTMVQKADSVAADGTIHHITALKNTYDAYGRELTETDADGRTTTTAYTPTTGTAPTSVSVTQPKVTGQTTAFATTTTLDPARGLDLKTTDAAGYSTTSTYDALGRLTAVWNPGFATDNNPNTKFSYNLSPSVPSTVTTQTLTDDNAYRTSVSIYDAMLRPRETQTATVDGGRTITDTVYDSHGWPVSSSDAYYNAGAPSGDLVDAADNQTPSQTGTLYDGAGRTTASIAYHFASETWRTSTAYPGSDRVDVTPPAGATPTTTYTDARGQLVKLLRYHGTTPTGTADTVTYSYDAAGHQIGQDDGQGHTWSNHYDLLGRRTSQTDPDTGNSSSSYDNAGQLLTTTDARGKTISYKYDELGRKTAEFDTTGGVAQSTGNELAAWTYDTLKKGKPTSSIRYVGGTSGSAYTEKVLGYDSHGWAQATELVVPAAEGALAGNYIHQNTYNLTGTLKNYTDQDPTTVKLPQETVSYTYDAYDRPTAVGGTTNSWSYVNKLSYTEFDEPYQFTYGTSGNFAQQTLNYDDQTHRLADSTTVTKSGAAIADKTAYSYQPSGNVTKISDKLENGQTDTQCFAYDWAQRLKSAWTATDDCAATPAPGAASTVGGPSPYWQSWTYDATGARATQVDHDPTGVTAKDATATYTPVAAGAGPAHAVSQVNTVVPGDSTANTTNSYTYDDDGNVLTRTTRAGTDTLTYNDEGALSDLSSTGSAGDTKYLYGADGTLLLRRSPDATTLYTGDEEITLKSGASSADGVRYISLAGETVATHSSDGTFSYLIPDRQGTGTLQIDSQSQQVVRRQYKPFGETRDQSGTWRGQQGYVGGTEDDNTGLTNLGAREYDPTIGRFLSPDPLLDPGSPQTWNAYDYAGDSPVTESDPSGLCMADQCGVGYPIGGTGTSKSNPTRYVTTGPVDPGGSNTAYCHHGNCTDGHKLGQGTGAGGGNINSKTYDPQAEAKAVQRAKATANAAAAAAKKQVSGLKHQLLSLVADVIGLTDAYNCFTKGDVMGCVNTALTAVPWGKVFKAIKVGVEAFKIWRALDRAYTAVKDAEEAARLAEDAVRAEHAMAEMRAAENAGADTAEGVACTVHSFVPGTGVRLADGTSKPISKVKVGDTVLATDPQTGVTAPEQVQQVIVTTTDKDFTTLTLDTAPTRGPPSGRSGQQTLTTTWHHPFWDATHHRWVDAHDLRPGTELRRADGTTVVVRGVRSFHQHGTTYDLTVGTLHTYYVLAGDTPLLVHNCPTGGAADLPDFDPNGIPRHQPGAAASRSGEASAESEAAAEEGKERAEFKTGAVEEVASVSQQIGDHIGQGVQATDPVTAAAVTITVTIDAVKKGLARRARRAAEGE
ncbi:RHS repeat-associated core domain-containing protein [Streptomyces griseorubiginosus]|uniref:RHS repeat-associated core domain-containing protein n=1 Tax=Streptomyces griseorubiginosus TaxID=67304 RepID=UPI002E81CF0D|nr:RHS repeat-associated core domain-containing protein [Streptomyces griseorubiginosus]WUB44684.1 polymorphic toxin-type HINT domain-containing protein [Streptomyces griseorubiginosus]WUB53201.1 polymorphic toxin-type HINT domain-containing protein [Streptomyces griseorubiginosus]